MSVQLSGIKGYEYQYKVTLLKALVLRDINIEMRVENGGTEDAVVNIKNDDGSQENIEIQVKRESGLLELPKLIEWLCHFEEQKDDNNLLRKLIDDENTKALFVTHSRCSDSISFLKKEFSQINGTIEFSISKEFSNSFLDELKKIRIGTTPLKRRREAFCHRQALQLNRRKINNFLKRCIIVEELTDEKVDIAVLQILNNNCQIAQSKAEEVYLKLLQIVTKGRDEGFDIIEKIKKLLESNKIGSPNVDYSYQTRSEEHKLISKLKEDCFLLLTGRSQCGKTQLAKKISEKFVLEGYDFCIENEISEVKQFLQSNILDNKIAILSDPFGHSELVERHVELTKNISDLLIEKQSHHLLIVTNRSEILLEAFNTHSLEDCKINQKNWYDLTLNDAHTISSFWKAISQEKSIPQTIINIVNTGILESGSQEQLQIGQLRYLSNEDIQKLEGKNFTELSYIARRDSREIANQLKRANSLSANLLSVVSFCSTPLYGINVKDLAYIMSDEKLLPSIQEEHLIRILSFNEEQFEFPKYSENFILDESIINALGYLEQRNFISATDSNLQIFTTTHSTFHIAGQNLFFENSTILLKKKLDLYKKCISCLNDQTAYIATKNLYFIYTHIHPTFKTQIIDYAFLALRSIFPAVEGNSLLFLTKVVEDLSVQQQERLFENIQRGGTDDYEIEWCEGIPFKGGEDGNFKNLFFKLPDNEMLIISEKLSNNELPSSYQIWGYIKNVKGKDIDKNSFKILLQVKEAFIRAEIMHKTLQNLEILDKDFIEFLFKDEHPTVIFNLISSVIQNWFNFSDELKSLFEELMIKSFNKTDVAIRAYGVIATFSVDYGSESIVEWKDFDEEQKIELWNLWGKIYPHIVASIPLKIHLNAARFSSTMSTAVRFIDLEIGMEVLKGWYKRIDYQISENKIIEEFEMSIMIDLLILTNENSEIRRDLFTNLINYNDTSFVLSNLKWALDGWEHLVETEKQQIADLIKTDRKDLRWIQAVILTSEVPPKDLVNEILCDGEFFSKEITDFVGEISESLLLDCLNVFCGTPQPLWWLALHHNNRDFWFNVMREILLNENNSSFKICLEDFLSDGVNGFTREWGDWESLWAIICNNSSEKKYLFERLLYNTANATCNLTSAKKLWAQLICAFDCQDQSDNIDSLILENLEILQQTGHGSEDVITIFEEQFFFKRIIPKISPDNTIFQIIDLIQKDQYREMGFDFFEKIIEENNTRFLGTLAYAKNVLDLQKEENQKVVEIIKEMNNKIYELGRAQMKQMDIFNYKLENWIGNN